MCRLDEVHFLSLQYADLGWGTCAFNSHSILFYLLFLNIRLYLVIFIIFCVALVVVVSFELDTSCVLVYLWRIYLYCRHILYVLIIKVRVKESRDTSIIGGIIWPSPFHMLLKDDVVLSLYVLVLVE